MTSFGRTVPDRVSCFTVPAETFDDGEITALILGDETLLPANANILGERADSLPDMACRLLRAVRLIPAALLSEFLHVIKANRLAWLRAFISRFLICTS